MAARDHSKKLLESASTLQNQRKQLVVEEVSRMRKMHPSASVTDFTEPQSTMMHKRGGLKSVDKIDSCEQTQILVCKTPQNRLKESSLQQ